MSNVNNKERLIYLAKEFDVFTVEEAKAIEESANDKNNIIHYEFIRGLSNDIIAIKKITLEDKRKPTVKISVSAKIFTNMILADPTVNKTNLQWMLNTFKRLIKDERIPDAIRFSEEDLTVAKEYLILFEKNKRKHKFIEWCNTNEHRKWLNHHKDETNLKWEDLKYNASNINQYRSLSQLFDAVDPFMEREASNLERQMNNFVNLGQAIIPYRDRKWTIFIPLTTDANCVMNNFAGWCTTKPGNSMFDSYTKNSKKPNGKNSNIYIIINNKLFTGESKECYQIHFETRQIKDRTNGSNVNIYEPILSTSEGVSEFFHAELDSMARQLKTIDNNLYLDFLIQFGFTESLFDFLDADIPMLKLQNRVVPKLPDISKFKNLDSLLLMKLDMHELHPSIGNLTKLELLSISGNKIKSLPKEIGKLKNLDFMNLIGNPIENIPDEIAELDKTRGGSLFRITVSEKDIGESNYKKLKKLLPSTHIVDGQNN
jgi:Leucine-rich repeat (LRR) protein